MVVDVACRSCGKPLPGREGRKGRSSVYCSAACRQKAYRERQTAPTDTVQGLIDDVGRQVEALVPQPPSVFYSGVNELASSVGRLRRIARVARDTANEDREGREGRQTSVTKAPVTEAPVTKAPVTEVALGESDFAALVESYRSELRVHCYRMSGSYDDAEDLVQETFLRAWRARDGFGGRASPRTWLYRIATNTCLDFQRRTARRPQRYEPLPGMNHGTGTEPRPASRGSSRTPTRTCPPRRTSRTPAPSRGRPWSSSSSPPSSICRPASAPSWSCATSSGSRPRRPPRRWR